MKNSNLCFVALFFINVLFLTACFFIDSPAPERPPLRLIHDLWPGYLPIILAQEKGFFEQQGVSVETLVTENASERVADFNAGKADGITLALGNIMIASADNPNAHIIFAIDRSAGADAVVAQPQIKKVSDLKGKSIGTTVGGFNELFVAKMLEANGLTLEDVTLLNVEGENVPELVQNGKIAAGSTWEPFVSKATALGLNVLFTSAQTPGLIPDVMVFQASVLRERPDDVRAFVRAWFQAVDYWKANPEEGKKIIAESLKLQPEMISLKGYELLTLNDNLKTFVPGNTLESLPYTAQLYANFFVKTGSLSRHPNINQLLEPSFL
ncbi:MAG: ABC transporter substrate-binding protein [Microcoleus vaginatus WJT46-NPBG5]|jgi:NitT/TauT family transport system substrate-binding protein|nr:ABC transporter substrate-binding protein [Microcoleus vaginatus WJT46-NPBG5]